MLFYVLLITTFLCMLFKFIQRWCLWFVFNYKFKNENSKLCKLSQRYAHILLGIGLGSIPRKVQNKNKNKKKKEGDL